MVVFYGGIKMSNESKGHVYMSKGSSIKVNNIESLEVSSEGLKIIIAGKWEVPKVVYDACVLDYEMKKYGEE